MQIFLILFLDFHPCCPNFQDFVSSSHWTSHIVSFALAAPLCPRPTFTTATGSLYMDNTPLASETPMLILSSLLSVTPFPSTIFHIIFFQIMVLSSYQHFWLRSFKIPWLLPIFHSQYPISYQTRTFSSDTLTKLSLQLPFLYLCPGSSLHILLCSLCGLLE